LPYAEFCHNTGKYDGGTEHHCHCGKMVSQGDKKTINSLIEVLKDNNEDEDVRTSATDKN